MSKEKEKIKETHNYFVKRSYAYDSHDKNGNFNGLTIEEWKNQIRKEWNYENLKANHITRIFHDKDEELSAHAIINFENSIPKSNAILLSKCTMEEDCIALYTKQQKSTTYRYLLHIDEKSLKAGKHIYGENDLEFSIKPGKKIDYHKMILCVDEEHEEHEEQSEKKLLKRVLDNIKNGYYETSEIIINNKTYTDEISTYKKILLDDKTRHLLNSKSNDKKIRFAIEQREEYLKLFKNLPRTKSEKAELEKQREERERKDIEKIKEEIRKTNEERFERNLSPLQPCEEKNIYERYGYGSKYGYC